VRLTPERATWLEGEIKSRIERKRELSQLDAYKTGRLVQSISVEDVRFAREMLSDLRRVWPDQTDEIKNIFMRLVLDRIELDGSKNAEAVQATLYWRSGACQVIEVLIPRKGMTNQRKWTPEEDAIIREHYHLGYRILAPMLPDRGWTNIVKRARKLGLAGARGHVSAALPRWTAAEDALIRRWAAGELTTSEVIEQMGRTARAIGARAEALGLKLSQRPVSWRIIESCENCEDACPSRFCRRSWHLKSPPAKSSSGPRRLSKS